MLRYVAPGPLKKILARAGTWLDLSVLQGSQKLTTVAPNTVGKQGQLDGTMHCRRNEEKQQAGSLCV